MASSCDEKKTMGVWSNFTPIIAGFPGPTLFENQFYYNQFQFFTKVTSSSPFEKYARQIRSSPQGSG